MSDSIQHECGLAFIRLRKPFAFYQQKYGTVMWGLNKLYLLMENVFHGAFHGARERDNLDLWQEILTAAAFREATAKSSSARTDRRAREPLRPDQPVLVHVRRRSGLRVHGLPADQLSEPGHTQHGRLNPLHLYGLAPHDGDARCRNPPRDGDCPGDAGEGAGPHGVLAARPGPSRGAERAEPG